MPQLSERHTDHDRSRFDDDFFPSDDSRDREISLGTGTILGIFFALALLCALFFGLGYSMGRRSLQGTGTTADTSTPGTNFSTFKPSAGNPALQATQGTSGIDNASTAKKENSPAAAQAPEADGNTPASTSKSAPILRESRESVATPETSPQTAVPAAPRSGTPALAPTPTPGAVAPTTVALPNASSNGTFVVQVAAISSAHPQDAEIEVDSLKKRGFPAFTRQMPQDSFIHVQVGPFTTRKDAELMRQRLTDAGYNAIVK